MARARGSTGAHCWAVAVLMAAMASVTARSLPQASVPGNRHVAHQEHDTVRPAGASPFPKPPVQQYAEMCRWLVHSAEWGTLSSLDRDTGAPQTHIVSHSDGALDSPSGRIFLYLTPRDATTRNLAADPRAAYSIVEAQLPGGCGATDPEDPTCAKIAVLGTVQAVSEEEEPMARAALFSRHPDMASWPADHGFKCYEFILSSVQLLDWYGGVHIVEAAEYYAASLPMAAVA